MNEDRHLWEIRWVRDLAYLTAVVLILVSAYLTRAVVLPILIALVLAYIVNPLVSFAERKWRVPRMIGTVAMILLGVLLMFSLLVLIVPPLVDQVSLLLSKLGSYGSWIRTESQPYIEQLMSFAQQETSDQADADAVAPQIPKDVDLAKVGSFLLASLNIGIGVVGSVINFATYLGVAVIVTAFFFFFFSWKFDPVIRWFKPFIPKNNREQILQTIKKMDRSVSAFVRGRVIQAMVMGIVLSVGWWYFKVPYWLLLGMGAGLLNLVPFAAVLGCIAAVVLALVDSLSGGGTFSWMVIVWPIVVYGVAQVLDGWVVEPIVQGKATDLDPLTVLLAVLIGGSLFGLMGLILAIPLTACGKILAQEMILPRLRDWAAKDG